MIRGGLIQPARCRSRIESVLPTGRHSIAAVYTWNNHKCRDFADKFGGTAYDSAEAAISAPNVDGVYIVTPHTSHYQYAKLALLLTGCAAPVSDENPSRSDAPAETTGAASSEEPSVAASESGAPTKTAGTVLQDDSSALPEEALLLGRMGLTEGETVGILAGAAGKINRDVAGMWAAYVAGPNGEDPLVESRDWGIYTSHLGLSSTQATYLYYWFRYNYPQYYFLEYACLNDGSSLYPCIFENMVGGEERAEITNKLFNKLDVWIQAVSNGGETTYEKEFYANKLICVTAAYNHNALKEENKNTLETKLCQSLYSTVMLENTVCTGYALAFCAMMNALDVEATLGISFTHAWNVVRFDDGNCYAVDVCWNDPDRHPYYKTDFLNSGEEIMSTTNSRKESHTYWEGYAAWIPAIVKDDYTPTTGDIQRLATPRNLEASQVNHNSVYLSWDGLDSVSGYQVFTLDGGELTLYKNILYNSERVRSLAPNTDYTFAVRSYWSDGGETVYSDWTNVTYTHTGDTAP